ncbi:DNA-directed RNA polymerase subunit beta', partial [Frankliniella fusca]
MIPIQGASYKLHSLRQQQYRHPGDEKDAKFHLDRQFCMHNLLTSTGDILDAVQIDRLIAPRCNIQQGEEQHVKEMVKGEYFKLTALFTARTRDEAAGGAGARGA